MTEQMNLRVDKKILQDFEELASYENLERGALVKKVLADGLERERLQFAIQKYVLHEISIERAAEIAKVSLHELIRVFENLGIPSNLTEDDLRDLLAMEL
ncbi:MAG TPA: UPF0175 family protein [Candidatus Lokiarchaeia archaeon]|nr:UPF0175 family protein [Candidatus Lokiarchaeia archaeon]